MRKCKEAYTPASQDEIKLLLEEYCQELKNTDGFKTRPQGSLRERSTGNGSRTTATTRVSSRSTSPEGCDACGGTGYKGRAGLHELLVGTDPIKKLIQEHARVAEMLAAALDEGMRTLKMDGMEKVLQGVTDMQQVRAVCIK